jgi:hypothetical protein
MGVVAGAFYETVCMQPRPCGGAMSAVGADRDCLVFASDDRLASWRACLTGLAPTVPHFLETIMKARIAYPAGLGVCLAALALAASGQTSSGNQTHATTDAAKTATGNAAVNSSSNPDQHHATAHHRSNTKQKHMARASPSDYRETAYSAALKQCVMGPTGQRDSCLDGAIARFGRA